MVGHRPWLTFVTFGCALVAGLTLPGNARAMAPGEAHHYATFVMQGQSMAPTLHNDQRLKVDVNAYQHSLPRRGDIVVFRATMAGASHRLWIKRVVGLPGEVLAIHSGSVYINGRRLSEPYVRTPPMYTFPPSRVPRGKYFLLGDNRNNSEDSHLFGVVPLRDIISKVVRAQ